MDNFDDCIVGLVERFGMEPVVVYDLRAVLDKLKAMGMEEDDAMEYYTFNQLGAWLGDATPAFIRVAPPPAREPLTDEQIDKVQEEAFKALAASGYTGGMGSEQWDRANARAIEAAHGIGEKP
jgi:hypothetical protein